MNSAKYWLVKSIYYHKLTNTLSFGQVTTFIIKDQQGATMEPQEEQKKEITIIKRALLVEDYEACQRVMSIFLQKLGYHVDLVDDSLTAIQKVQSEAYDLIMVDINLQGHRAGKKIIKSIRESERNVDTSSIVWSAYVNKNDEEEYLSWGADAALKKACGIEDLKKSIQQCLLTPRYERKLKYKLKILQKKWQENSPAEWIKKIN
ncbi:MAG TPA: response regulator, partial [Flavobacterium sp.]|nr:response regulator [Flavobacterium sp.]